MSAIFPILNFLAMLECENVGLNTQVGYRSCQQIGAATVREQVDLLHSGSLRDHANDILEILHRELGGLAVDVVTEERPPVPPAGHVNTMHTNSRPRK